MKLPLYPLPYKGESISFYLVRLAKINARPSVNDLLVATGLINHKYLSIDSQKLLAHVNRITGHDADIFVANCLPKVDLGYTVTNWVYPYREFVINSPRLCPVCMAEHRSVPAKWQYLPYTYCLEHDHKLLFECPDCKQPFKWDAGLLSYGCSSCGFSWNKMIQKDGHIPKYLTAFLQLSNSNEKLDFMNDLMVSSQVSKRPYDSMIEERKSRLSADITDWHRILNRAYQMMTDKVFISTWIKSCSQSRCEIKQLGMNAINYPIEALIKKLVLNWPLHDFKNNRSNTTNSVSSLNAFSLSQLPTRMVSISKESADTDLRYQVMSQDVSILLGCRLLDIRILIEHGYLNPINNPKKMRYAIFDLRTLASGLNHLNPNKNSSYIHLKTALYLLSFFHIEFGHILVNILSKQIPAYIDQSAVNMKEGLYLSRYGLLRTLRQSLYSNHSTQIKRDNVPKLIGITEADLNGLSKAEILQPTPCHKGKGCYTKKELTDLNNHYFLLSRWAKLRQLNPNIIRKKLAENNILPVVGRNLYTKNVKPHAVRIARELEEQPLMTIIKPNRVF